MSSSGFLWAKPRGRERLPIWATPAGKGEEEVGGRMWWRALCCPLAEAPSQNPPKDLGNDANHLYTQTCTHAHIHTYRFMGAHTHTHTGSYAHKCQTCVCTHILSPKLIRMCVRTHRNMIIGTNTHACIQAHMPAHAQSPINLLLYFCFAWSWDL